MNIDLIGWGYTLSIIYAAVILSFSVGIFRLSKKRDLELKPLSVVIAARNEEANIEKLIEALDAQDYPEALFEVIIVDDRSEDNTYEILKKKEAEYNWLRISRIIKENVNLIGKKGALAQGISEAKHEILAFTDADCIPGKKWLSEINVLMTHETDFLCGFSPLIGYSLINKLKNLERSSIFAVIAGSFGLGLGLVSVARNQVYRKSSFLRIGGFGELGKEKSGDDDLMLQKLSPVLKKRNFIFSPEAAVPSLDKQNTREQINLETRRASKWRLYPPAIKLLTLFIFIYYLYLTMIFILTIVCIFPLTAFIYQILMKLSSEFILLWIFLSRQKQLRQLLWFPLAELIYIPYYVYFGLRGTFGSYTWK
jgi:poly-beta-1,6-N-acetyl-D-glucosamine synthase